MKKFLTVLFACAMLLYGCGSESVQEQQQEPQQQTQNQSTEGSAPETKPTETKPDEEETSIVAEGDLGHYHVAIKSAQTCEDSEGNPAIMITYSWTNNSDETTSPFAVLMEKAYQDGVQLDPTFPDFEYKDNFVEVQPGYSNDVGVLFATTSDSKVDFEITSIDDVMSDSPATVKATFDPATLPTR